MTYKTTGSKLITTSSTLAQIFVLCFMLSGCTKPEGTFEGKLVEPKVMLDQKKFIKESAKRMEDTSKYGPKIIDIDGHISHPAVAKALAEINNKASLMKILGSYPKAVL